MSHQDTSPPSDFEAQLTKSSGFLITMLGQESRRRFMAYVSSQNIGWPHQSVLGILLDLGSEGTASQRELGEAAHIDPRNLVAILDTLAERDLIERVPDSLDRRRAGIRLTEGGSRLARELRATSARLESDFFAGLSRAERATLHRLLLKLYRGIQDDHATP